MDRVLLVGRLAARNLRRRPVEAALVLLAIVGATATFTLGLVLHGMTGTPYQSTREATAGPDVVALGWPPATSGSEVDRLGPGSSLEALNSESGVVEHSGPYPVTAVVLEADGRRVNAQVMGRDVTPAPVDQPLLTEGRWVADGGVVFEAAFADALGVGPGDEVSLDGHSFRVVGVAITAATPPYPEESCLAGFCSGDAGLVWLTQADTLALDPRQVDMAYVLNLRLAEPSAAPGFVDEHLNRPPEPAGMSWQDILERADRRLRHQRRALLTGGWLLALLAVASVAVLVGGRMADQTRRVGLLKAVGGTPGLIAAVLLAEHVVVAVVAAAAGLALGWLTAPLLIDPGAGLVGRVGAPAITLSTIGAVTGVAIGVAVAATLVPAIRAARTSSVNGLTDAVRPPRRAAWLITASARLPVPLLLGLRVAARRPRRVVLSAVSVFVTTSGIVAVLGANAELDSGQLELDPSGIDRLHQVLLVISITSIALAAVNAIFITWATAVDNRRSSALARALGATTRDVSAGLSASQVLPALAGALLSIPGGLALLSVADPDGATLPPLWQLFAVVPVTVLVMAALSAIPARLGARRPLAQTLRAERA